jgi:uncharacterized delta-60 repeat protein
VAVSGEDAYAAGWRYQPAGGGYRYDFAVAKYGADGALDPGFSGDGRATADFGDLITARSDDLARAVSVTQPDGKVLVAGYGYSPYAGSAAAPVARFNPDGTLDASFGDGGRAAVDGVGEFRSLAVLPGGKVTFDVTGEAGDWAFHCHMLYHMHAGMFQVFKVRA